MGLAKTSKTATPEEYIASSIIRFGRLHRYIEEKLLIDKFAIQGNLKMADGLRIYIQNNLEDLKAKKKINLLDIGPAIGAFSAMLALQVLDEFGLLQKAQIHLLDVSSKVIEETQKCNFFYPQSVLRPELKSKIFRKLRQCKVAIASAEKIPWKDNYFTLVLAGFVFHHIHDEIKPKAAKEAMRVLAPGGFLGIAEEWFKDYEEYAAIHKEDEIPLAYESIISLNKMKKLLPTLQIFYAHNKTPRENSYAFCGIK